MGLLRSLGRKIFLNSERDESSNKSPKLLATPCPSRSSIIKLSLSSTEFSSSSSSSTSTSSSTSFWTTPRAPAAWSPRRYLPSRLRSVTKKRLLVVVVCASLAFLLCTSPSTSLRRSQPPHVSLGSSPSGTHHILQPQPSHAAEKHAPDPQAWLEQNSNNRYAVNERYGLRETIENLARVSNRPRAAIISLVRNSELEGIAQSMRQLEYRWNRKYQYPWIFFNDEPFSDEFKQATQNLTSARCYYEVIPLEHWSLPDWVDEGRFMNSLEYLGTIGVGKGWMVSYRHMCRWNSGFFYRHPRLANFDWYWRVEPDVHFFCDIDYDVFRFMRDNALAYGFNMNILDDARSFPSLWSRTRAFINEHPHLVHPDADLDWLLDPHNGADYNNCQFFSNFEVGDLRFFRGEANGKYFEWLDRGGGFYYERFGDAPIHTLSVAMFAPKRKIWYFRDIGYQHDINRHCPPHAPGRCACEPTPLDENFYRLVPLESPQRKPDDSCIRQFLGGDWLLKKDGWSREGERMYGGDGYHGYVRTGLEGLAVDDGAEGS